MHCPKCLEDSKVKAGFNAGKQRYKCKICGCHFTRSTKKGYSTSVRKQAIQLYLEGLGFRAIGRILGVSNVAVLNWVREAGKAITPCEPKGSLTESVLLEMDEMWHYVQKKADNYGCGLLLIVSPNKSLPGKSVAVVCSQPESSLKN